MKILNKELLPFVDDRTQAAIYALCSGLIEVVEVSPNFNQVI